MVETPGQACWFPCNKVNMAGCRLTCCEVVPGPVVRLVQEAASAGHLIKQPLRQDGQQQLLVVVPAISSDASITESRSDSTTTMTSRPACLPFVWAHSAFMLWARLRVGKDSVLESPQRLPHAMVIIEPGFHNS
ncbi:hypothetical protein HaLaN_05833 [Haematococcus lacustris]|uniref:Uncharacterized protein n=1 Tax=Haematococcus lacustris TaxID=44745 RepID=A0A699YJT9_HAELA|nr:hypothetical protein HaLaN_05833 [Haematococcus lacustris]